MSTAAIDIRRLIEQVDDPGGDVVRVEIDGIGTLENPFAERPAIEWQEKIGPIGGGPNTPAPGSPKAAATADGKSVSGSVSVGGGK